MAVFAVAAEPLVHARARVARCAADHRRASGCARVAYIPSNVARVRCAVRNLALIAMPTGSASARVPGVSARVRAARAMVYSAHSGPAFGNVALVARVGIGARARPEGFSRRHPPPWAFAFSFRSVDAWQAKFQVAFVNTADMVGRGVSKVGGTAYLRLAGIADMVVVTVADQVALVSDTVSVTVARIQFRHTNIILAIPALKFLCIRIGINAGYCSTSTHSHVANAAHKIHIIIKAAVGGPRIALAFASHAIIKGVGRITKCKVCW